MSRCRLVAGAFVCAVAKKHNGAPNHLPPAGLHVPPELKEGVCGNYYLKRAIVNTQLGLGANLPEDAIYPINIADETGKPLDGGSAYVLHFDRGATPPANTFWSVTLYDAQGYQVVNSLNRFAVSSWMPFKHNPDGSLVQNASPGLDKEANWLPTPTGPFTLTMRPYAPKSEALTGKWNPWKKDCLDAQQRALRGGQSALFTPRIAGAERHPNRPR